MVTQERLTELVKYDPETGLFTRKVKRGPCRSGSVISSKRMDDYLRMCIDYKVYFAHRMAWLYMTGGHVSMIDHKDGDASNNKWCNLREANPMQNQYNAKLSKRNKSGCKGVRLIKDTGRWTAQIGIDGKRVHLGTFDSRENASKAYISKARSLAGDFVREI